MELIESVNNERIKELSKLKDKKYRDQTNTFLVEGDHLVEEAYKMNQLQEVFVVPDHNIDLDIKTTYVKENVIKKISELENTKIVGLCKKFKPLSYGKRLMILDNLQDPGNIGTIIRSAAAFNIDSVILTNNSCDLYNSKTIRATQGLIFHIDVLELDQITLLEELKNNNYKIYGTDVVTGTSLHEINFKGKVAFIIGNEGSGLSSTSKEYVTDNIYIPMNRKCESLNASVAASIIMYELSKVDYE